MMLSAELETDILQNNKLYLGKCKVSRQLKRFLKKNFLGVNRICFDCVLFYLQGGFFHKDGRPCFSIKKVGLP